MIMSDTEQSNKDFHEWRFRRSLAWSNFLKQQEIIENFKRAHETALAAMRDVARTHWEEFEHYSELLDKREEKIILDNDL